LFADDCRVLLLVARCRRGARDALWNRSCRAVAIRMLLTGPCVLKDDQGEGPPVSNGDRRDSANGRDRDEGHPTAGARETDAMSRNSAHPRWPKDNGMDIPEEEWEAAVGFLVRHVSLQTWAQIQQTRSENGPRWYVGEGRGLGRAVRYLLAKGGFRWGSVCIQANWFRLVEEGARRVFFVRIELQDAGRGAAASVPPGHADEGTGTANNVGIGTSVVQDDRATDSHSRD
jgi:hypothetical protein